MSSLSRHLPREPTSAEDIEAMAKTAWLQRGWACLQVDTIRSDWVRAAIEAEMIERYGKRGRT